MGSLSTGTKLAEKLKPFVKEARSDADQVSICALFSNFIQYFLDTWYVPLRLESSVIWSFLFLLILFPNLSLDKFLS